MLKARFIFLISLIFLSLSVSTVQAKDERTPEQKAYDFRDGLFNVIEWRFVKMIEAKFAGDKAGFHKNAMQISKLSDMITEGFVPNSMVDGTKAKQDIWDDWDEFKAKVAEFKSNMDGLADPAYDIADFDPKKFGGDNCGSCHRAFKSRTAHKN